ncbi:MAG: DUF2065 family protein [Gammaproteobacteria bacterium]|nr:DUF2065 family protein [Gammaproteobacteria bacterium]
MWRDLGVAMCLVLVIEGIVPFLYPRRWRHMALSLAEVDDRTMRLAGLTSMVAGTVLLYLVR